MFETVVPERVTPRRRAFFYQLLPVSIGLHVLAAGSLAASSLWTIEFPDSAPRTVAAYQLIATPTPPPPPPPPPAPRRAPVVPQTRAVPVKMPLVAPTIVPDEIPQVVEEAPFVQEVPEVAGAADGGVEGGVEGGVAGGEIGGVIGGVTGGLPTMPEPEVIEVKRDAPLPMGAISQEYPRYPEFAWKRMIEDTLVVRYTIGKDGRVKEVIVLTPPQFEEFTRETVSKIKRWRFHPYMGENGEAKEVSHELTVEFRIVRKGR